MQESNTGFMDFLLVLLLPLGEAVAGDAGNVQVRGGLEQAQGTPTTVSPLFLAHFVKS